MKIYIKPKDIKCSTTLKSDIINQSTPKIEPFNFQRKDSIMDDSTPLIEDKRLEDLIEWNCCLTNRLDKLRESFILAFTNYNRKLKEKYLRPTPEGALNDFLFDYYAEIFYYYYFSTQDVIVQILNVYYIIIYDKETLLLKEKLYFDDKFLTKIEDEKVRKTLLKFLKQTIESKNYRNSFTHRFTPNLVDHRPVRSCVDGEDRLTFGTYKVLNSKDLIEDIQKLYSLLSNLMMELKISINT